MLRGWLSITWTFIVVGVSLLSKNNVSPAVAWESSRKGTPLAEHLLGMSSSLPSHLLRDFRWLFCSDATGRPTSCATTQRGVVASPTKTRRVHEY